MCFCQDLKVQRQSHYCSRSSRLLASCLLAGMAKDEERMERKRKKKEEDEGKRIAAAKRKFNFRK